MANDFATVQSLRLACQTRDVSSIVELIAEDGFLVEDGGGNVAVEAAPVHGPAEVARVLLGAFAGQQLSDAEVNGTPGLVLRDGGRVSGVACITVDDSFVTEIWLTLNPAKLVSWNRLPSISPNSSQS